MGMTCPHCDKDISLFDKAMNRMGKVKACPHCGGPVKLRIDWKRYLLWVVPLMVVAFMLKPVLGYVGTGMAVAFALMMSMALDAA